MAISSAATIVLIIVLSLISGLGDAYGFTHAAKIWQGNKFILAELIKSALGFAVGISIYWIVIKFMNQVGIRTAEIQTAIWFATTMIGVSLLSGEFARWENYNKLVAVLILIGIGWLLMHEK